MTPNTTVMTQVNLEQPRKGCSRLAKVVAVATWVKAPEHDGRRVIMSSRHPSPRHVLCSRDTALAVSEGKLNHEPR